MSVSTVDYTNNLKGDPSQATPRSFLSNKSTAIIGYTFSTVVKTAETVMVRCKKTCDKEDFKIQLLDAMQAMDPKELLDIYKSNIPDLCEPLLKHDQITAYTNICYRHLHHIELKTEEDR